MSGIPAYQIGGQGEVSVPFPPILAPRDPISNSTNPAIADTVGPNGAPYNILQQWFNTTSKNIFTYQGTGTWVLTSATTGDVVSLSDTANTLTTPNASGNIQISGTTNQILVTAGVSLLTLSLPSAMTVPGSLTATTFLAAGTTVTAGTGITATTGNIVATTGNITATAGNIAATAGSVSAGTTVTAGTGITATTGNIVATTGNITATAGNIAATAGSVAAGTTVTAGTGITATTGNIVATTGNVTATAGNLTAPGTASGLLLAPTVVAAAGSPQTANGRVGSVTFSGVSIAAGATQAFVINNTSITGSSTVLLVGMTGATTGAALNIQSVVNASNQSTITVENGTGATTSVANITFTYLVLN